MAWNGVAPAQTFARTNGTNTGATTWAQDKAGLTNILSTRHDTHDQDIADGLNACFKKDGGNTATANLPMGGFTLSNIAAATSSSQPARASDVQNNRLSYCTVTGTANAIVLTNTLAISAYVAGQEFRFFAAYTNTSSVTVAVDGLSALNLTIASAALTAGQILAGSAQTVRVNAAATGLELVTAGVAPSNVSVGTVMAWPTSSVPTGWLECDGSAVSRTTYAALFGVISTTYGTGDGSTTFNLPNYKDYFLRGYDASGTNAATRTDRGDGTTGANVGTKQASDYLSHTHTGTTDSSGAHSHTVTNKYYSFVAGASSIDALVDASAAPNITISGDQLTPPTSSTDGAHTHTFTTAASPTSGGSETRPKNITVKWIILAVPSAYVATAQVAPYFTCLSTDFTGSDVNTAQPVFSGSQDAFTSPASMTYEFEALYNITRAAGGNSHTTSVLFGGTATFTSIQYSIESTTTTGAPTATTASQQLIATVATATVAATTSTSTTENIVIKLKGIMRINGSGTIIPQFQYSVAPGGAPTVKANSYFKLTPMGDNTVTTNGSWA